MDIFYCQGLVGKRTEHRFLKNQKYSILRYMYNDSKGYLNMITIVTSAVDIHVLIEIRF